MNAVIEIRPGFLGFDPWVKLDLRIRSSFLGVLNRADVILGYIEQDTREIPEFCRLASRREF
ncbi:hypothetical protein SEA_ENGINEER_172 [Gordonia Phage Engineer]|nr:hypothetical protein SEA_ENGINEER_172 [Gordonia Phage Engineer]